MREGGWRWSPDLAEEKRAKLKRWSPKCLFFLPPSFKLSLSTLLHLWLLYISLWCRSMPSHPRIPIYFSVFFFPFGRCCCRPQMWWGCERVRAARMRRRRRMRQHVGLLLLQLFWGLRRTVVWRADIRRRRRGYSGSVYTRFWLQFPKVRAEMHSPFLLGSGSFLYYYYFCTVSSILMGPGTLSEAVRNFECTQAFREGLFTFFPHFLCSRMNKSAVMAKSQFPFEVVTLLTFVVHHTVSPWAPSNPTNVKRTKVGLISH